MFSIYLFLYIFLIFQCSFRVPVSDSPTKLQLSAIFERTRSERDPTIEWVVELWRNLEGGQEVLDWKKAKKWNLILNKFFNLIFFRIFKKILKNRPKFSFLIESDIYWTNKNTRQRIYPPHFAF